MKVQKNTLQQDIAPDRQFSSPEPTAAPDRKRVLPWPNLPDSLDLYTILALLIAAFAVRLYSLQFFQVISTDGTSYALTARAFAQGDLHGIGIYGFYPVLISLAHIFISDLETAGRTVSVISGSLLVVPLYFLGKSLFSRKVAVSAALLCIVWPPMVASSCEVMTQATHTTLQLTAVFLLWQAFRKQSALIGSMAGLFMGLTFLTRSEGIILFVVMPLALCIFNYRELLQKRLLIASYYGSFLLPFLANAFLVHHITGEWQLSAKTDSALTDALSYYLKIPDLNYVAGYEPKGYLDILRDHPDFIWKNSLKNLKATWHTMLPPPLWLFAAVGFFSGGTDRANRTVKLFLLASFTPVAVLIVFYYISNGYIEAYLPVMFLLAAAGFSSLEAKIKQLAATILSPGKAEGLQQVPLLLTAAFIYAGIVFLPQVRPNITDAEYWPHQDGGRRSEKHIGLLLKENLPPGKIMTRWARIAFYAEREWANVPVAFFDEIIRTAKEQHVRFLIADGYLFKNRPGFGPEIFAALNDRTVPYGLYFNENPDVRIKGLRPYLLYKNPRSIGVAVYEILD